MRHVYLYVHDLRSSGVVRNAIDFGRRAAEEHPTTLVAGFGEGFFAEEAARGPFSLAVLGARARAPARLRAALALRRWLTTQPPGVLMSVGNLGHWTPYLACQGLDHIARVYCLSNEVVRPDGWRSALRLGWAGLLMRDARRVVLVGEANSALPQFADALRRGRAVELPNGVDLALASRRAAEPAPHPWLEEATPVVLGVARLRPAKNLDVLIRAVGLARQRRRLRLAIIGKGSAAERRRLAALAVAAGLGDDFLLAGETDNVFAWLSRAAVFALPSLWEASSIALLEALATGTPVVAARQAGDAAKVLGEGRYGLLFDGYSAQALADALLRQASDEAVRPGGRAADYSLDAANDGYARLVREVQGEAPRTVAGLAQAWY